MPAVVKVLCEVAHRDIHFKTIIGNTRDSATKDNI